jgi:hypothetical protein
MQMNTTVLPPVKILAGFMGSPTFQVGSLMSSFPGIR